MHTKVCSLVLAGQSWLSIRHPCLRGELDKRLETWRLYLCDHCDHCDTVFIWGSLTLITNLP